MVTVVEVFPFCWMHTNIVWPLESFIVLKEFRKVVQPGKKNKLGKQ